MDISITNIFIRNILGISSFHSATGPWLLGGLAAAAPSDPGFNGLLCCTLHQGLSSVAATDWPPRRGLPPKTATALLSLPPSTLHRSLPPLPSPPKPPSEYPSGQSIFRTLLGRASASYPAQRCWWWRYTNVVCSWWAAQGSAAALEVESWSQPAAAASTAAAADWAAGGDVVGDMAQWRPPDPGSRSPPIASAGKSCRLSLQRRRRRRRLGRQGLRARPAACARGGARDPQCGLLLLKGIGGRLRWWWRLQGGGATGGEG